jgi:hypothetical protein
LLLAWILAAAVSCPIDGAGDGVLSRAAAAGQHQRREGADYLVITHHSLAAHLGPLVQLRENLGLTVCVVEDTTIYNSFPLQDSCSAIKEFISVAYQDWDPQPSFILLVGDADEAGGIGDLIPSKVFPKFSYWYAGGCQTHCSDNWYVELEGGDYVPELAIGRLPAASVQELDEMVQKTVNYEQTTDRIDTAMVVIAGEYVSVSASVFEQIPEDCVSTKLYGTQISGDSCRTGIIATYHSGCDLVFGLCHGCYPTSPSHTWSGQFGGAHAVVFSDADFASLPNQGSCPILFEWG